MRKRSAAAVRLRVPPLLVPLCLEARSPTLNELAEFILARRAALEAGGAPTAPAAVQAAAELAVTTNSNAAKVAAAATAATPAPAQPQAAPTTAAAASAAAAAAVHALVVARGSCSDAELEMQAQLERSCLVSVMNILSTQLHQVVRGQGPLAGSKLMLAGYREALALLLIKVSYVSQSATVVCATIKHTVVAARAEQCLAYHQSVHESSCLYLTSYTAITECLLLPTVPLLLQLMKEERPFTGVLATELQTAVSRLFTTGQAFFRPRCERRAAFLVTCLELYNQRQLTDSQAVAVKVIPTITTLLLYSVCSTSSA
jgi:hypothetical protein